MTMLKHKIFSSDKALIAQPELIKQFGRIEAQFLNQLHRLLTETTKINIQDWRWDNNLCNKDKPEFFSKRRIHEGRYWVYHTIQEWAEQLACSARILNNHIIKLRELGVISTKVLMRTKLRKGLSYTINYDNLEKILSKSFLKEDN